MSVAQFGQAIGRDAGMPPAFPRRDKERAALTLLFRAGGRPSVADVMALLEVPDAGVVACTGHHSAPERGSMEIVMNGLVFELRGLSPALPVAIQSASHAYGFSGAIPDEGLEAIELGVSGHVSEGSGLKPVVHEIFHLAANLSMRLPPVAVIWAPARTLLESTHFARIVYDWLAGGAFPALGLSVLAVDSDGSIVSRGLAHFAGQEIRLEGRTGDAPAEAMRLATRAADWLVRNGPLDEPCRVPSGREMLFGEPSRTGRHVWLWRDDA